MEHCNIQVLCCYFMDSIFCSALTKLSNIVLFSLCSLASAVLSRSSFSPLLTIYWLSLLMFSYSCSRRDYRKVIWLRYRVRAGFQSLPEGMRLGCSDQECVRVVLKRLRSLHWGARGLDALIYIYSQINNQLPCSGPHPSHYIIAMKNTLKIINEADKTIIISPQKTLFSLIWLHGLGDSSAGFLDFFQLPQSPAFNGCRVKLLHAPVMPVTVNGGMKCPSWYDIKVLSFEGTEQDEAKRCNLEEVNQSLKTLDKKVQQQIDYLKSVNVEGDPASRVFVGGFSQGCAISILYALTTDRKLGGAIGLSGYLFNSFKLNNTALPVLLYHGKYDSMIPFDSARKSYAKILDKPNITFKAAHLDHEVSMEELKQITQWLNQRMAAPSL